MFESKTEGYPQPLDWFRYFCAFMLYTYGISKLLHYGPFLILGLICIFLLTILWHQRSALMSLLWTAQKSEPASSRRRHRWIRLSIVSVTITMMISGAIIQKYVQRSREQSLHPPALKSHY